jgi:hypothetical protein
VSVYGTVHCGENALLQPAGKRLSPVNCTACRVQGKPGCIAVGRTVLNCIFTVLEIKYRARNAFIFLLVGLRVNLQNQINLGAHLWSGIAFC